MNQDDQEELRALGNAFSNLACGSGLRTNDGSGNKDNPIVIRVMNTMAEKMENIVKRNS